MYYNIKRNNVLIASVVAEGNYTAQIMGDELVNMSFTLPSPVEFLIGDYVEVYNQGFILNIAPTEEKISSIQYNYTLQFESVKYDLGKIQFMFPDSENHLSISDFSVMGDAKRVLELIVQNANRVQNGWKLGIVDETETINFSFSAHNLLTSLTMLADEFKTEFWIDKDKTIHLTKKQEFSGLALQIGQSKGLRSLSRTPVDGSNIVTRLYAVGGAKNIASDYRNHSNRLKMDVPFLEANVSQFGIIEHTEIFEDVYPNRKGKVTAVNVDNPLQFMDVDLDFDLNSPEVLIPNTTAKVTFNTGQLAGYTLEIKEFGFNNATKTFELNPNQEEKAITIPSELIRPAVGDEYVLTDIIMPLQYVTEAEAVLKVKATEYLTANCLPRLQYSVVSDPFYFEAQNVEIILGKTVKMIDTDFNLDADIRVISLSKSLQDKYDVAFELADEVHMSNIVREYLADQAWQNQVINHNQQIDRNIRRNYQFTREIQDNIFDTDGYFDTDKIKPLSIDTKMLSVGARSQQFQIKDVQMSIVDNSTVRNTSGQMVHFTISDSERVWNILAVQINNISAVFNYVYLRCQREGNQASFFITTEQINFDTDPNFYHFEYGYLSSIMEGFRKIKTSYGFSTINGGEITSGKILGQNGDLFIDIDNREIIGKVKFLPDSPAIDQINQSIQIGGRNLLLDSSFSRNYNNIIEQESIKQAFFSKNDYDDKSLDLTTVNALNLYSDNALEDCYAYLSQIMTLEKNTDYVLSFFIRSGGSIIGNSSYYKLGDVHYSIVFTHDISKKTQRVIQNFNSGDETSLKLRFGFLKSWAAWISVFGIKIEKGNKVTDWTPATEDVDASILQSKQDSINASKAYSDAQDELNKIIAAAYADGIVDETEQRLIDLTNAKVEAARMYSDAQDALLRTQIEAYADGIITAEEAERIRQMQEYLSAAKAYADAQAELARIIAAAYADGIVDEEESRAIAEANTKLVEAKNYATGLVNNIQIGGRNLLLDSSFSRNYNNIIEQTSIKNAFFSKNDYDDKSLDLTTVNALNLYSDNALEDCYAYLSQIMTLEKNTDYVLSFFIRSGGSIIGNSSYYKLGDVHYSIVFTHDISKKTQRVIQNFNSGDETSLKLRFGFLKSWAAWISVFGIKIEKGNKVTDWTPAPEDVENAINDVKIKAENALTQLTSIANDNILSPSEKQQVSNEWTRIKSEYTSNYSLGVSNGIDIVNYANSYNELYNYINPLLVDLSSESSIVGEIFRTKFKYYYDHNISILSAVNDKIKQGINNNATNISNLNASLTLINKITSFLGTTIDGNVIGTGVLMVGSESQSNAGISGLNEAGSKSVRIWAGGTAQNRDKSAFNVLDDGTQQFFHPNGRIAFRFGVNNGKFIMDGYHEDGMKLWELSPNRGLINVAYISESWNPTPMINVNQGSIILDLTAAKSTLNSLVLEDFRYPGQIGEDGFYRWYFNKNYTSFEYQNGTHPDFNQYLNLTGYKSSDTSRVNNIANGWYGLFVDTLTNAFGEFPPPRPIVNYILYYIEDGKVTKTQNINF